MMNDQEDLLYSNALDTDYKPPISETNPYLTRENTKIRYHPESETYEIKAINIDSRFRQNKDESTSDFMFQLPERIKNVFKMRLSSVELPSSFYRFCTAKHNTNFFLIDENGIEHEIVIQEGNYSQTQMINEISSKLPSGFDISHNTINNKVTISSSGGENFSLNFNPCEIPRDTHYGLGYWLGYREKQYSGDSSYTTESLLDTFLESYLFVEVNDFNVSDSYPVVSYTENSIINTKILGKILVRSDRNEITFDDNSDFLERRRIYRGPVDIERLRIRILDAFGETIDLNKVDVSLTLELNIIINSETALKY
jgi:hypothetical protein